VGGRLLPPRSLFFPARSGRSGATGGKSRGSGVRGSSDFFHCGCVMGGASCGWGSLGFF
jgi:hypothetical protein